MVFLFPFFLFQKYIHAASGGIRSHIDHEPFQAFYGKIFSFRSLIIDQDLHDQLFLYIKNSVRQFCQGFFKLILVYRTKAQQIELISLCL